MIVALISCGVVVGVLCMPLVIAVVARGRYVLGEVERWQYGLRVLEAHARPGIELAEDDGIENFLTHRNIRVFPASTRPRDQDTASAPQGLLKIPGPYS